MKIVFSSLYKKNTHVQFETSIILLFMSIAPSAEFVYIGSREHGEEIEKNLIGKKITFVTCRYSNPSLVSFFTLTKIVFRKNSIFVNLSGIVPTIGYFFSFCQDYIFQHQPWWINNSQSNLKKIICFINFHITLWVNRKCKIITMGKWIEENYKKNIYLFRSQKRRFYSIDHPYLIKTIRGIKVKKKGKSKIIFGLPKITQMGYKGNIDFIPDIIKHVETIKGAEVKVMPNQHMSEKEYQSFFSECSFMIIPYVQNYEYACSGIFIDAIIYKVPIICLNSPQSNYFFGTYGNIGYNCESLKILLKKIKEAGRSKEKYLRQIRIITTISNRLKNKKYLGEQLKAIMESK